MKSVSFHEEHIKAAYNLTGFKELKYIFESEHNIELPLSVITNEMKKQYGFTDAKINGIVFRATQKHLLYKTGRGVYMINLDYPDGTADYIKDEIQNDMTAYDIVQTEINKCIRNIDEKINISDLNTDDFNWLSQIVTALKSVISDNCKN